MHDDAPNPPVLLLSRLADRASDDPWFVGWALAAYCRLNPAPIWDHERTLGIAKDTPERWRQLALCRRPLPAAPAFRAEVDRIAAYVGCDAEALAALLSDPAVSGTLTTPPEKSAGRS